MGKRIKLTTAVQILQNWKGEQENRHWCLEDAHQRGGICLKIRQFLPHRGTTVCAIRIVTEVEIQTSLPMTDLMAVKVRNAILELEDSLRALEEYYDLS